MRNFLAAGAVSVLLTLNAGAGFAQDEINADTVIASVNGAEITLGHVIVLRNQLPTEYQSLPDDVLFDGIINQIIEQTLLADSVKANELEIPREVGLALENEERALMASVLIEEVVAAKSRRRLCKPLMKVPMATFRQSPSLTPRTFWWRPKKKRRP